MRLQPASALTEDISGKKEAIKFRVRWGKRGRIEKKNNPSFLKPGYFLPVPSIQNMGLRPTFLCSGV